MLKKSTIGSGGTGQRALFAGSTIFLCQTLRWQFFLSCKWYIFLVNRGVSHVVLQIIVHEILVWFRLFFFILADSIVCVDLLGFRLDLCCYEHQLSPMYSLVIFWCEVVALYILCRELTGNVVGIYKEKQFEPYYHLLDYHL